MSKLFPIVLFLLIFLTSCYAKRYEYFSYTEILDKMKELALKYPHYCKLTDVKLMYNYIIPTNCGKSKCEHWYLTISDFNAPVEYTNSLPQVFLLAGIHGDEVIGTNALINLAEYLLQKNEEDEDITNLIKSRVIILLPLANPSGFYHKTRQEKQSSGKTFDPNRDFPYNLETGQCFQTASARVINYIFKTHLVQAAITFHGAYPWGAFNHIKGSDPVGNPHADECPDDKAFSDIADILSKRAGSNSFLFIKPYPTGRMTDIVYAVNGGLEDWSYAASWETQFTPDIIPTCDPEHQEVEIPASESKYDSQSIRTLIYLIEASDIKQPTNAYLGSSEGLEDTSDPYAYGYIPMNMKLCISLIDIVAPYPKITSMDYSEEMKTLTVQWQGRGCKTVDATYLEWNNTEGGSIFSQTTAAKQGPGYHDNEAHRFKETISLNTTNFNIGFTVKLTCDQDWGSQQSPVPAIGPQTHIVQARINQDYLAEANGYKATGKKIVELSMNDITSDFLTKKRTQNIKNLTLAIDFMDCSSSKYVGSVIGQTVVSSDKAALLFSGKLNVEDSFLEGHLHQYGDISRCSDSVGGIVNIATFQDETVFENSLLFTMQKEGTKTVNIDFKMDLTGENAVGMIGKGVLLQRSTPSDKIYVGQIALAQPDSCKKANDMKNCIGVDLGSLNAVCVMNVALEEDVHDFKLFLQPGDDGNSVIINGFIPNKIMESYYQFDDIFIVHENIEKKFFVDKKKLPGYGLILENSFNLYPDAALGTMIRVYIQAMGDKFFLGDCSVGLRDPSFNETQYLIEHASVKLTDDELIFQRQMFYMGLVVLVVILIGVVIGLLIKRYHKVKVKSFEGAMSARKEKYADTARMVATARGAVSAREAGSSRGIVSLRGSASERPNFNIESQRARNSETKREFDRKKYVDSNNHIILPEEPGDLEASR